MTRVLLAFAVLASAAVAWHISRGDPGRLFICNCPADQLDPDCTIHRP